MKIRDAALISWTVTAAFSEPPAEYYTSAEGKRGAELQLALHKILHNHTVIPYSSTRFDTSDALKQLEEDPMDTNNVVGIYSRQSEAKSVFGLTTGWNREHLWPNSYGLDDQEPAFSDLHNLRAEDANVNSSRGNKFFDESDPLSRLFRFPAHPEAPLCSTDSDSWEPPESAKGDIARALFYMAIRYNGDVPDEPALNLTDHDEWIASTNSFIGRLSTLLRWSQADPVDSSERKRNDGVYTLQKNRNPFVDHPEWVSATFLPILDLHIAANGTTLSWTNAVPVMVIEQAFVLGSHWTVLTNLPVISSSNTWSLSVNSPEIKGFFRLRLK